MSVRSTFQTLLGLFSLLALSAHVSADERLFGYSYEADVLPKGSMEFEQWATLQIGQADGYFSRWKVREEFEFGVLDNLAASIYINLVSAYTSVQDTSVSPAVTTSTQEFAFDGISTEWKLQLLNPNQDALGLLLYFEPRFSGPELELENKIVLQKNLGESFVLILNATEESEFSFVAGDDSMANKFEVSGGAAYKVTPRTSVGLEVMDRVVYASTSSAQTSGAFYAGTVIHYAAEKWWGTLACMPQIKGFPESIPGDGRFLGNDDFSRVETRLVAGVNF